MKTLQIDEKKAKFLFKTADAQFKEVLIDTFGKDFFSEKITDVVKTFEDACEILNIDPKKVDMCFLPAPERKHCFAYYKLTIIARALNEGWTPDWDNSNENKYYPYFDMRSSTGFGFSATDCDGWDSVTIVGSRLCFKTRALAEYAGKQFSKEYQEYMVTG